mgnify:CR=1 FL=1
MKIICIGRNYAKHAKEMNAEVPSEPIFFLKPDTALLKENNFYYPEFTKDLHYELELVLKINKHGKHISKEHAGNYYEQISLGIDFTARDVQKECKAKGLPWEKAKAFDNSAFLSTNFQSKDDLGEEINFELKKNGESVQMGSTNDLLFDFDSLIAHISQYITLKQGDLIYTGTPEGVGPVEIGDQLDGFLNGEKQFSLKIK